MRTGITLKDVVTDPQDVMGVKAVWGPATDALMCVRLRGQAQTIAERAQTQPYILYIGGSGKQVPPRLRGRVLELARVAPDYGETADLARNDELRKQLAHWQFAVIVSELHSVKSQPSLVEDLGFPDRRILASSYGNVVGTEKEIQHLWNALKDHELSSVAI